MSLVIFIVQSLLRSLSSSESRSIVKVDKFDENLPEVINQINQLSYKTFNDLPRGGFGDHGHDDLDQNVDHDDSNGGRSDPSLQATFYHPGDLCF